MGKQWKQCQTLFWGAPKSLQTVIGAMKLKDTYSLGGMFWPPTQHIKKQRHYSANRSPSSQNYGFSSSHVWMWKLDYKKCWVLKNWCFWTVFWRRLLRVPWSARRYNQSILKENSPEYSLEGLMLKLKLQSIVWPHDMKNWLTRKDPDTGREWRQEKGMTEDEMVGWHHWLNGREFE